MKGKLREKGWKREGGRRREKMEGKGRERG